MRRSDAWRIIVASIRASRFGFVLVAALIALAPPHLVWLALTGGRPSPFSRPFFRLVCAAMGLRLRSQSLRRPSALIVANHVSWTDVLVLGAFEPVIFIAKAEVRRWPVLGSLAALNPTLFIDRTTRMTVGSQVDALRMALRRGSVVLFPEGTSSDGSDVLPFRSALFAAARDFLVQPITIRYTPAHGGEWGPQGLSRFAWYGEKPFLSHFLQVICGEPIRCELVLHSPMRMEGDRKAVAEACRSAIAAPLSLSASRATS